MLSTITPKMRADTELTFVSLVILLIILAATPCHADTAASPSGLRILFLGDDGHHRPEDRFKQIQPIVGERGIRISYTSSLDDLNPAKLAGYDCLLIYANHT